MARYGIDPRNTANGHYEKDITGGGHRILDFPVDRRAFFVRPVGADGKFLMMSADDVRKLVIGVAEAEPESALQLTAYPVTDKEYERFLKSGRLVK